MCFRDVRLHACQSLSRPMSQRRYAGKLTGLGCQGGNQICWASFCHPPPLAQEKIPNHNHTRCLASNRGKKQESGVRTRVDCPHCIEVSTKSVPQYCGSTDSRWEPTCCNLLIANPVNDELPFLTTKSPPRSQLSPVSSRWNFARTLSPRYCSC